MKFSMPFLQFLHFRWSSFQFSWGVDDVCHGCRHCHGSVSSQSDRHSDRLTDDIWIRCHEAIAFCSIILAYAAYNSANTKWGDGWSLGWRMTNSYNEFRHTHIYHIAVNSCYLRLAKNILISNLGMTKTLMGDMSSSSSRYNAFVV